MKLLNGCGKPLNGAKVLLLGVAYKKDIADIRESPALKIAQLLRGRGAIVSYHDPYVSKAKLGEVDMESLPLTEETLSSHDLVIITTAHTGVDYRLVVEASPLVFDTRNATAGIDSANKVAILGAGNRPVFERVQRLMEIGK